MVKTLTKFAKFPRLVGKGKDKIIFVKVNTHNFNVAELRVKSNAINTENISKKLMDSVSQTCPDSAAKKAQLHMI